jgi:hypothetical protein
MTDRQIAYAAVRYKDANGQILTGRRSEVCDIPDSEIERISKQHPGALVAPDVELFKPGALLPLNEDADDEKIRNYLVSGNSNEILTQAGEYPTSLVEKLLVAERAGLERESLVAGLSRRVGSLSTGVPLAETAEGLTGSSTVEDNAPSTPEDELAQFVATSNKDEILERAGDDPELAEALKDAEEARGKKARSTLVDALDKIITEGTDDATPPEE